LRRVVALHDGLLNALSGFTHRAGMTAFEWRDGAARHHKQDHRRRDRCGDLDRTPFFRLPVELGDEAIGLRLRAADAQ
jgi:hypothetical protein